MNSIHKRIQLVDALRGFALLGIVLIHFVEHFELFKQPEYNFLFSKEANSAVFEAIYFLISGKAYSIFAIMFGFSFFIQLSRRERTGDDFRLTFVKRLIILLIFGIIHSFIYRGDILHIYAFLGLFLVLFYKVSNKTLLIFTVLFAIQIPHIYHLIQTFLNADYQYIRDWGGNYFSNCDEIYAYGNFIDVLKINVWEGRYVVWAWTYYSGRLVQLFALFLLGLYIGRKGFFENPQKYKSQIFKALIISIFSIISLYVFIAFFAKVNFTETQKLLINEILKSYINLGYTFAIISIFSLYCISVKESFFIKKLAVYGRMSLTNYVTQAVFGVIIFYGFGFGLYNYLGAIWSLIIGFSFFIVQVFISEYWMKNYYYGPLEWLWRALTFSNFQLKFRRVIKD